MIPRTLKFFCFFLASLFLLETSAFSGDFSTPVRGRAKIVLNAKLKQKIIEATSFAEEIANIIWTYAEFPAHLFNHQRVRAIVRANGCSYIGTYERPNLHKGVFIYPLEYPRSIFIFNEDSSFRALVAPKNVGSIALIGSNLFVAAREEGLFISRDNGENFETPKTSPDILGDVVSAVVTYDDHVFVGSNEGISVSCDKGQTFEHFAGYFQVTSLAFHQGKLIAGTSYRDPERRDLVLYSLIISSDFGRSFTKIPPPAPILNESYCAIDYHNGILAIAGAKKIYISNNGGNSFDEELRGCSNSNFITAVIIRYPHVFVGTNRGLVISHDWGKTYEIKTRRDGLADSEINCLHFDNDCLFVGTENGLSISYDFGKTFEQGDK